jgi:transposase-like protein
MRGKKGVLHPDPADPPRRRANKTRGHGNWDTDRPPVFGMIGRDTGHVRLRVGKSPTSEALGTFVADTTQPDVTLNTDEWKGYARVATTGRTHVTVCHTPGKRVWAKDLDGDGINEVHNNTIEGFWTGLRNFLRPFRGVSKRLLSAYTAMHAWAHNLKTITDDFLRILLRKQPVTDKKT